MPGRHAPPNSKSFLISLGTAVGGALAALALVGGVALVVTSTSNKTTPAPQTQPTSTPIRSHRVAPSVRTSVSPSSSPASNVASVKLRILNATNRRGLASSMATRAQNEGYPPAQVGDYQTKESRSTIYYRAGAQQDAVAFQQRFPEFTQVQPAPPTFRTDVNLTVVIGADYPASSSPSPSAT